jgi:hypothetical protein
LGGTNSNQKTNKEEKMTRSQEKKNEVKFSFSAEEMSSIELLEVASNMFRFRQNNSGGRTVTNSSIASEVYMEASCKKEAIKKAKEIGIHLDNGDGCECCGDRWPHYDVQLISDLYTTLTTGFFDEKLQIKILEENKNKNNHFAVIHKNDGKKVYIVLV